MIRRGVAALLALAGMLAGGPAAAQSVAEFYKGKQIGTRHQYDYRLALAVLNAPPRPPRERGTR